MQSSNLNGYSPTGYNQPPEGKRRPKLGLIILVLLLVVVITGGVFAGYIFLKNQNQNGNTVPTRVTTPSVKPLFSDAFNDDNSLVDFRLDVDASLSKGDPTNGYGVFIRGALGPDGNLGTYYRFELYGDGTYAIFKGSPDASGKTLSNQVHGYTASSAILKGSQVNHITIIARGSSMTFMVNGQALYTYVDNNYKSGSVALFVSNLLTLPAGAQATFSHLAIFPATQNIP